FESGTNGGGRTSIRAERSPRQWRATPKQHELQKCRLAIGGGIRRRRQVFSCICRFEETYSLWQNLGTEPRARRSSMRVYRAKSKNWGIASSRSKGCCAPTAPKKT